MIDVIELTIELINRVSITPDDKGCQEVLIEQLKPFGFTVERLRFGNVDNLWLRRGTQSPVFVFAGHTDVVHAGDESQWHSPPFSATIDSDGVLFGRGAADMKGGLAAMVCACQSFVDKNPNHKGSIAFLITSDEEGDAKNGTKKVIEHLQHREETIDWCVIGEPSSQDQLGDTIKNGRRGSMHGYLTIHGIQGHIAYPHLAKNPIHEAVLAVKSLVDYQWDQGNEYFPPTSFQVWQMDSGVGVSNVIPAKCQVSFNFRFSSQVTAKQLQEKVVAILDQYQLQYNIKWNVSGHPFITPKGELVTASHQAIKKVTGLESQLSTSGGTSDGRFIALTGCQVVEIGLINATIHQINECTKIDDIKNLCLIYQSILEHLLME